MGSGWESYLDKTFQKPTFIWENEKCNVEALSISNRHLPQRLTEILSTVDLPAHVPSTDRPEADHIVFSPAPTLRKDVTPSTSTVIPLKSDVWNGIEPINYHAQITVGTLEKPFFVDLDTGSSLLWLQARLSAEDAAIPDQTTYVPAKSTTSQDLKERSTISYGDGAQVFASLFKDKVTAGSLIVDSLLLGGASTHDIKDSFRSKASNGMLGLGFPLKQNTSGTRASAKNLVLALQAAGRVKYASMSIVGPRNDPKKAAEIDKNVTMQPRGVLIIGSVDPSYYTGHISWCPQLVPDRWIVKLDAVLINGKTVFKDQRALIDTGTAYIVASPQRYNSVQQAIPGATPLPSKKGRYFTYPKENLQTVSFKFGDRVMNMFPQDFSLGRIEDKQNVETTETDPVTGQSKTVTKEVTRVCSSIIRLKDWPFDENMWIIGGIFLDNIVTIFDFGNSQIGFADISENDIEHGAGKKSPT